LTEWSFRAPIYRGDTNEEHKQRSEPLFSKTKSVNFLIARAQVFQKLPEL
jgi:hypothetical protein